MTPLINLDNISKHYQTGREQHQVLADVSLTVYPGEFLSIMGPSGSGKSTLINIIGFLDTAYTGSYTFLEHDVQTLSEPEKAHYRNNYVGFVFQNFKLIDEISLAENIILPLLYAGVPRKEALKRVEPMLEKVGLAGFGNRLPRELSGGQQQRVAIARALINKPKFLIADEPTGALDSATSADIMRLFREINQTLGTSIIMVTHDPKVATQTDRIVKILDGHLLEDDANA